ncbi:hypothetical protein RvY_10271 [Ramazzottius varieornatus]|uniref:Uncharacterized protein n=1 Tax=Ramazzottius varieornatus TaxID=947166 RepID=A0A1D1VC83_RAMVA|nr:hypothetical protein RvY_10271 [Ramazzottius varieornatus]
MDVSVAMFWPCVTPVSRFYGEPSPVLRETGHCLLLREMKGRRKWTLRRLAGRRETSEEHSLEMNAVVGKTPAAPTDKADRLAQKLTSK